MVGRTKSGMGLAGLVLGAGLAWSAGLPRVLADDKADQRPAENKDAAATPGDLLIFRDGKVMTGTIVSESETSVRFKSEVAGIPFETDYDKSLLLEVKRAPKAATGHKSDKPAAASLAVSAAASPQKPAPTKVQEPASEGATRYYWLNLKGEFGGDITQTPIREAMKDARNKKADVVVISLDSDWVNPYNKEQELEDFQAHFDELFRAESMTPIFVSEMPTEWEKMPRLVFYVKSAMAGAAFLPLVCKEIYFAPDAKLGGIGNLSTMMKGHERVVAKQVSLRLQHAVGWANVGGYPEELVRAMSMVEYVLSMKMVDGKPTFFERMPEGPDEELLTDDGKDERLDTLEALARGEGNDVLTFNARRAQMCGVSKGTVESDEALLAVLGLDRGAVKVSDRADIIMQTWSRNIATAKKNILRLLDEYQNVEVRQPGGYNERTAARGARRSKLEQIRAIMRQWGEGISPYWLRQNNVPDDATLLNEIEQIKTEQLLDKK